MHLVEVGHRAVRSRRPRRSRRSGRCRRPSSRRSRRRRSSAGPGRCRRAGGRGRFGSLCRQMRFSQRAWRMPSIIEAWLQRVREDHRAGEPRAEGGERRPVRDVARGEEQRRLLAVQVGELALEQHVLVGGAGDVAGAAGAGAVLVDRGVHRREHLRVLAHAEVVVRAPDGDVGGAVADEAAGAREVAAAAGELGEDAVVALLAEGVELAAEQGVVVHRAVLRLHRSGRAGTAAGAGQHRRDRGEKQGEAKREGRLLDRAKRRESQQREPGCGFILRSAFDGPPSVPPSSQLRRFRTSRWNSTHP